MVSRHVRVDKSSFYCSVFSIFDKYRRLHAIRRLCHDPPSRRTIRVFLAKKKLPSRREQTYGWTGYRSSFKKRIIALRLHVTRLTRMTRSRALYTPVKSDGYCIAWSINDRACFTLLHVDFYTRGNIISESFHTDYED